MQDMSCARGQSAGFCIGVEFSLEVRGQAKHAGLIIYHLLGLVHCHMTGVLVMNQSELHHKHNPLFLSFLH